MTIRRGGSPRGDSRGDPPAGSARDGAQRYPSVEGGPSLPRIPGIVGLGTLFGPAISALALIVIAVASVSILNGQVPTLPGNNNGGPIKTPTPSGVINVDGRANIHGTLVYVKDGNLWLQSGAQARQLTTTGNDAMPADTCYPAVAIRWKLL